MLEKKQEIIYNYNNVTENKVKNILPPDDARKSLAIHRDRNKKKNTRY